MKKRARILLRVSSNQQLEADGDLTVQREIVKDYVLKHKDWILDTKEYFEGSNSGYKNAVKDRDVLQEALVDAKNNEYDILVVYKDDRIGRRMWEIGSYVMQLKSYGVDIYTTKDNCISPESDDVMGQMMLALRYGNAQKSSSDTGQRVKDTAQKLVKRGKFMGGKAPYGYELVLSGELSKHGRALHKLKKIPERVKVVKYIYDLSLNKEFGSAKIAKLLNEDAYYQTLAPNDNWKSGTITSILTNPIYCGITAYKRREKIDGKYHSLDSSDWIYADEINEEIAIIDKNIWNTVQEKRSNRSVRYRKGVLEEKNVNVLLRNDGELTLIDVAYCGYCGRKLTNGSKYNYWTIKSTGEKRASKIPIYKCQTAWQGVPHNPIKFFKADKIEEIVFKYIAQYISVLQNNTEVYEQIKRNNNEEKNLFLQRIKKEKQELNKTIEGIEVMKSHLPEAMLGNYPLSIEVIADTIKQFEDKKETQEKNVQQLLQQYEKMDVEEKDWNEICDMIPSWINVFNNADKKTKRVLINKLVDKILITNEEITVKFKINVGYPRQPQPRISDNNGVPKQTVIRGYKSLKFNDLIINL